MSQPSLLDLPEPTTVEHPVATEYKRRGGNALRVLNFLKLHGSATNVELCTPEVGGLRAVGRVHDLRQDGWDIESQHVSGGTYRYVFHGLRKP